MDVIAAYRDVGSYRGAAVICGTTHKTVKRIIEAHEAGNVGVERTRRARNYDDLTELVANRLKDTAGRISAKRLLPEARAAGYVGSARNFRRLVAEAKTAWRQDHHQGRRPGIWAPGEISMIDWGVLDGVHLFCAVLAWSRFRLVRFVADEKAATTLGLLAECFEELGGVPKVVLADRMGCLKGGVVANVVVPTPGLRPVRHSLPVPARLLRGRRPAVQGDGGEPGRLCQDRPDGRAADRRRVAASTWWPPTQQRRRGAQRSTPRPIRRSTRPRPSGWPTERELLAALPSLRPEFGAKPTTRKVDKLSCIRFASGRYSVPNRLIGAMVTVLVDVRTLRGDRAGQRGDPRRTRARRTR